MELKIAMPRIIYIALMSLWINSCGSDVNKKPTLETKPPINVTANEASVDVALKFINGYVENCNKMKAATGRMDWVNSNGLVTERFKSKLRKITNEAYQNDPESGLDSDPIVDAQDYPENGFELEILDWETNYLTVRGRNWLQFKLTMKVVNENGNWLVDGSGMINIPDNKRAER